MLNAKNAKSQLNSGLFRLFASLCFRLPPLPPLAPIRVPFLALPFEYSEDHEDEFNYDLDEAQSQAKYDARLLSEQMLSDAELQQRADTESGYSSSSSTSSNPNSSSNNGAQSAAGAVGSSAAEDDLEPHSRAAACFTNGHKYTHGQKVSVSVCACVRVRACVCVGYAHLPHLCVTQTNVLALIRALTLALIRFHVRLWFSYQLRLAALNDLVRLCFCRIYL